MARCAKVGQAVKNDERGATEAAVVEARCDSNDGSPHLYGQGSRK